MILVMTLGFVFPSTSAPGVVALMAETPLPYLADLCRLGLLTEEEAEGLREEFEGSDPELEDVIDRLRTQGRLTEYQAKALRDGRADSLVVGNYLLLDILGTGGMGAVYRARHRRMKRLVAIKFLTRLGDRSRRIFRGFRGRLRRSRRSRTRTLWRRLTRTSRSLGRTW